MNKASSQKLFLNDMCSWELYEKLYLGQYNPSPHRGSKRRQQAHLNNVVPSLHIQTANNEGEVTESSFPLIPSFPMPKRC